ncbi:MAG: NACHT domain-containing protein [Planctomycetaceae bacterium]|nr:NACHT domain-containing protein [Planctomycetaceae bacterium]
MDPYDFEQEVRRLARLRWPQAAMGGAEMVGARERDGIFLTEECVHLLECTTSRSKAKAQHDLKKLFDLYKKYRSSHQDRAIKCWFVTLEEPTAEQRACRKEIKGSPDNLFNVVSFSQFQSALVDARSYLQQRSSHKFGSVYDPRAQNAVSDIGYIEVGLHVENVAEAATIDDLSEALLEGKRFTILGEYGIGKSMTLRELYRRLAKRYELNKTPKFPLYINLREHQGQREPAEIIERHARNIGFDPPSQLVRAWKAGYAILLLDGFDEVSSAGLQGAWRRLRDARSASMAGIRQLIGDGPPKCGIAIAGREHFFDTVDERRRAIGQTGEWYNVRLDEFAETQILALMKQFDIKAEVPAWFPTRPLLLSTLFAGTLRAGAQLNWASLTDPAKGWDFLLTEVTEREARIESGVTGANIRAILESLATVARRKEGGVGPISTADIVGAFESECGFSPTDEALIVLQRLPGLGRDAGIAEDARNFVDRDFADACRAGEVAKFCVDPYGIYGQRLAATQVTLGEVGTALVSHVLSTTGFNAGKLVAAAKAMERMADCGAIAADLFLIAKEMHLSTNTTIRIQGLCFDRIGLEDDGLDLSPYQFSECIVEVLEIPSDIDSSKCPRFDDCLIPEVEGRTGERDLPRDIFNNCTFGSFSGSVLTTSAALDLPIALGARVALTIMKKLFVQSVSGRKENALFRGLAPELRGMVPDVLATLSRHCFVMKSTRGSQPIWLPVRQMRDRVLRIIASPSTTTEPVMIEVRGT